MKSDAVLHKPSYLKEEKENRIFLIAPSLPHWIATEPKGEKILSYIDGKKTFEQIVENYRVDMSLDASRAWVHCDHFLNDALRKKFISEMPFSETSYDGRDHYLKTKKLKELWIQTNNSCNLTCSHCLVSSAPDGLQGPDTEAFKKVIDQAFDLGVERFYITGGEPMVRKDFWDLASYITQKAELAVLTNATLLKGKNLEKLKTFDPEVLTLQVSLDGPNAEINDPIRGQGSFDSAVAGIKNALDAGFLPTLTTVITRLNVNCLPEIVHLAKDLGLQSVHFLWMHLKGRACQTLASNALLGAPVSDILKGLDKARAAARETGIYLDNIEATKTRMGGPAGQKWDLSNACWESLAIYPDGTVYPSAAMVQVPELALGNVFKEPLKKIWLDAKIAEQMRKTSVVNLKQCENCQFKFLCGGGDIEHRYFYSGVGKNGQAFIGEDPYCEIYQYLMNHAMKEMAKKGDGRNGKKTGFDAPYIFCGMGDVRTHDFGIKAPEEIEKSETPHDVSVKHSNCVLSFDLDTYRKPVRKFYGNAAEKPQADLCCPIKYESEYLSHIPQEVLDVFYGCGGPMQEADVQPGMTVLDLGSGGGIDCFIASKRVGKEGRVIGIDMTDQMLERAERNHKKVSENLGYDNVEFRKGFLEEVPAKDNSVDLVTSNCVINLSPDKRKVFREIWRILKDHGTIHISDIVTEEELPLYLATNEQLVGECVGQALTENQLLAYLEQAGFYGITVKKKFFWKEVEGHQIYSVSVSGQKFEKKKGCVFIGQKAVYHGPFKAVLDEEGHRFPRNEAIEVCTDTASKLSHAPYQSFFTVLDPKGEIESACCCSPSTEGSSCSTEGSSCC